MQFDVLIRHGLVVDGTGAAPFTADVGLADGRIAAVGDLGAATANTVIDASGKVVAPGFIDSHAHSDLAWSLSAEHADVASASVRQGVTTEVSGNCGFSPFPLLEVHRGESEQQLRTVFGPTRLEWSDLDGLRGAVARSGHFVNLAPLIGHGSLRAAVMGFDERAPNQAEARVMRELVRTAFEQGAFGLSSGLIYAPGMYARTEEVIDLASVARDSGRLYTSHIRGETDMVADSVREAIRIGREAKVPAHISHHKTAGKRNWGRTHETLGIIRDALSDGLDVSVDMYPYTAGSTVLHALLPRWAQAGGIAAMLERIRGREVRDRIRREFEESHSGWEDLRAAAGWEGIVIATCPDESVQGHSIAQLADSASADRTDVMLDLLVAHQAQITVILDVMHPDDIDRVIGFERAMIGSDGLPIPGKPHPRLAGTFSRILGKHVREKHQLSLADAVRKMTSLPAERFGIRDRGTLAAGRVADLVVFDAASVDDRATFADPLLTPVGVSDVFVGGTAVVRDGQLAGARPGRMLAAR